MTNRSEEVRDPSCNVILDDGLKIDQQFMVSHRGSAITVDFVDGNQPKAASTEETEGPMEIPPESNR